MTCLSIDLASLLRIKADASCYGLSFGLIFVRGGSLPLCSADAGGSCGSGDVGDLGDFERVSVGGSEFVSVKEDTAWANLSVAYPYSKDLTFLEG